MKLLIKKTNIISMNSKDQIIEKGYLITENDFIKEVGGGEAPSGEYDRVIDGSNQMLLPGFINTHTHAAMTLLRGYADDLPLMEWLENKIWPLEARLTPEDVYWGTMLAITEMIKSGTTCFADMYFFMEQAAEAVAISGIRAVLARGMVGVAPENQQAIVESRELARNWHGAKNGRIRVMLGPHAPYTCPPEYLTQVVGLAEELDLGIHIHLAETRGEYEDIINTYGKTPTTYLENLGIFNRQVLAAHCVHLSPEDIAILKQNGVGVAHNPESNMKLASGIAPVYDLLKNGVTVALGTDGASSNNNLDLLQEMRSACLLQKVHLNDPTAIPAYQALEMATTNGAKVLGISDQVGKIAPGMKADFILVSLDEPHMIPRFDIIANLVYSAQAADVQTVVIDGKIIMENRQIKAFDEKTVLQQAKEAARRLIKF